MSGREVANVGDGGKDGGRGASPAERFRRLDADGPQPPQLPPEPDRWARLRRSLLLYVRLVLIVIVVAFLGGILVAQIRGRVIEQVGPSPAQSVGVRTPVAARVVS